MGYLVKNRTWHIRNSSKLDAMPFVKDFTLNEIWEQEVVIPDPMPTPPGNSFSVQSIGDVEELIETPTGRYQSDMDPETLTGCFINHIKEDESNTNKVALKRLAYKSANKALLIKLDGVIKSGDKIELVCYLPDRMSNLPEDGTYLMNYGYGLKTIPNLDLVYDYDIMYVGKFII